MYTLPLRFLLSQCNYFDFLGSYREWSLLLNLRKAKVPKINLKAIVTEQNAGWSFYHLYEEIGEEHRLMNGGAQ